MKVFQVNVGVRAGFQHLGQSWHFHIPLARSNKMYLVFTKNFTSGYNRCMRYLQDIIGHPKELEIKKRVKIIDFFDKYGLGATKEAFRVSRFTIYLWKKKLKDSEVNSVGYHQEIKH